MTQTDRRPAPKDREEPVNPYSQVKSPTHRLNRRRRRLISKISRRRNLR